QVVNQPDFTPLSFRAGNWLFQPAQTAASILAEKGIKIESSVFKGGLQHNHCLDYRRALRNGYYWPFNSDVNVPDPMGPWIEVPIHTEMVPFWRMPTSKRLGFSNGFGIAGQRARQKLNRALDFMRFRYPLKLDFCRMTLNELTSMVNRLIQEDREEPALYRPVVAIGHTKDLTDAQTVDAFLSFLRTKEIPVSTFEHVYPKLLPERGTAELVIPSKNLEMGSYPTASASADRGTGGATSLRYVLITPARDEAQFIELTIKSVVAQTVRPTKWVIVSDGSTDGTDDIVKKYAADYPWIELVRMPERRERHFAGKAHAFNAGYAKVKDLVYDVIGNLDADITFDEDYLDFLLRKFADNRWLGVAGTPFKQGSFQYDYRFTSIEHVSGACQLFRRECFQEIGGYVPVKIGGIDLVAVLKARMKGWQTRTFPEKTCVHHRVMGTAKQNRLAVAFVGGGGDYMFGTHPAWELFRCIYQMTHRPIVLGGIFYLAGFIWAAIHRIEKAVPPDLAQFRRAEQMRRLHSFTKNHRAALTKQIQKIGWIYLRKKFIINKMTDLKMIDPAVTCSFVPMTSENCFGVRDFRNESRIAEYRNKLANKEIGFFAECDGKMVGSIWATINKADAPAVVLRYMRLMPNRALIHDIVTGEDFRGMGIAPFMLARMASVLLNDYAVSTIIDDVSLRNNSSLRVMDKLGVQATDTTLYLSAFGKLMVKKSITTYGRAQKIWTWS